MSESPLAWYAVYARPGMNQKLERGLQTIGLRVYAPVATVWRRTRAATGRREVPLLGTYLFVGVPQSRSVFEAMSVFGIAGVVVVAGDPCVLPSRWVEFLQRAQRIGLFDKTRTKPALSFTAGQPVMITQGMFKGYSASVILAASAETRVKIMLKGLGGGAMSIDGRHLAAA